MVAHPVKARTPARDDELIARMAVTAAQPGFCGFTVNREGLACIESELDDKGRFMGFGIFCVVPQKERVRGWWAAGDLDNYLNQFKLKT